MTAASGDDAADVFGEVISSYSRAQAIEDGVLVDVSEPAREAGIRWPVAVTRAVWASCVEVPAGARCQDIRGRLWDVVWMTRCAMQTAPQGADTVAVSLLVVQDARRCDARTGRSCPPVRRRVTLKAIVGPGDDGAPVVTIMEPDED